MQSQKIYFGLLFTALIGTALLHYLALHYGLYWTIWWFDFIVHAAGGAAVGFFYFAFRRYFVPMERYLSPVITFLLWALFIGTSWEVFELLTHTAGGVGRETYLSDTGLDFVADLFGAVLAGLISLNKK